MKYRSLAISLSLITAGCGGGTSVSDTDGTNPDSDSLIPTVITNAGAEASTLSPTHSLLCVEIPDSATTNDIPVVQAECNNEDNQSFLMSNSGQTQIVAAHSGKCLQVRDNSTSLGASVIQSDCQNNTSEFWRIDAVAGGIRISNDHSGLCLGVTDRSRAVGTPLNQWPCNGQDNQVYISGSRDPDSIENTNTGGASNTISSASGTARWSEVKTLPLIPVAAANLSNGKVLMWSSYSRFDFYGDGKKTATALYDPITDTASERVVQHTRHDMFCPGIANLPDGRILVSGGSSHSETSIYNPETDSWEAAADMNVGRGYHSNVTLSDGGVFTLGGSWTGGVGDKSAEVFRDDSWQRLDGIEASDSIVTSDFRGLFRGDNHMWLFAWEDGQIFQAGPSKTMHWIDTNGDGSVQSAGLRGSDDDSMNGNAVMFDVGKILTVGGSLDYDTSAASANTHVIDITSGTAQARTVESIKRERVFHNSVVLPSGEVIVIGGHDFARAFSDRGSVLVPELFDPQTETWVDLPAMQIPRNYHSVALLLPDGRVMSGGGGLCDDCDTNHPDVEILTPPYLLNENQVLKQRPQIFSAPDTSAYGETIAVSATDSITEFVLMRSSNSTHSVNNGQRRIPLLSNSTGIDSFDVRIPANSGIAPPGPYMLFGLDETGTPSVSTYISLVR